jgi:hypothetical protein
MDDNYNINGLHISKQTFKMLRNNTNKTPYEISKGRLPNVKHFRVFGSK